MKTKMTVTVVALTALLLGTAQAELRVWTDKSGKTIEAEHVRTLTDQVVLRQADGTELRVSLNTLSERDRKYAVLQTPPKITINVSTDTDRTNKGFGGSFQMQQEDIQAEVTIKKTSSAPYEAPLRAVLILIGEPEQSGHSIILEKQMERFNFTQGSEVRFESGKISLRQLESGYDRGVEYKGYVVAVMDKNGDTLGIKCSKLAYEKNAKALLAGSRGTVFDEDYKVVGRKQDANKPSQQNPMKQNWRRGF